MTVLMSDDKTKGPWKKNKSYLNRELVALHHVLIAANCVEVAL